MLRYMYLLIVIAAFLPNALAQGISIGDEVRLSASNPNGVPMHRLAQSSLIGYAQNGSTAVVEDVHASERWLRVSWDEASAWVLAANAALTTNGVGDSEVTALDRAMLLEAPCESTGNRERLTHSLFVVCFDKDWRIPVWVAYKLQRGAMSGPGDRHKSSWEQDARIEAMLQAFDDDYVGTGWHRGHMAPAEAFTRTQSAVDFTHIFSNAVPQSGSVNSGAWSKLEGQVRALVDKGATAWIYTGSLSLELPSECLELPIDPKCRCLDAAGGPVAPVREMSQRVSIPSHTFKTVLVEKGGDWNGYGFVMANIHRAMGSFLNYQYSIAEIEQRLQINLYPGLDPATEQRAKSNMSSISTRQGRDRCQ